MNFTDKVDVTTTISLYEYGIIRNPKTDKCIICINTHELEANWGQLDADSIKPIIRIDHISLEDVKEGLEEMKQGYFDFIGSTKKEELHALDNEYLSHHITSMNQYNGYFDQCWY
jgi:hypothetical protein